MSPVFSDLGGTMKASVVWETSAKKSIDLGPLPVEFNPPEKPEPTIQVKVNVHMLDGQEAIRISLPRTYRIRHYCNGRSEDATADIETFARRYDFRSGEIDIDLITGHLRVTIQN